MDNIINYKNIENYRTGNLNEAIRSMTLNIIETAYSSILENNELTEEKLDEMVIAVSDDDEVNDYIDNKIQLQIEKFMGRNYIEKENVIRDEVQFSYDLCNRNMDVFDELDDTYQFISNDIASEGHGFEFVGRKDKFQPIIKVIIFSFNKKIDISIIVNNRNGNSIIYGDTVARYSMKAEYKENMTEEEIKEFDKRYRKMAKQAIEKWSKFNKENQIGYKEREDEEKEEF